MLRMIVDGLLLAAMATGATALWACSDGNDSQPAPENLLLDRPEARAPACPTAAPMVWTENRWDMQIGPVVMHFAHDAVGSKKQVFTGKFADGLKQKIPLHIEAAPGTPFAIRATKLDSGAAMRWDGPTEMPTIARPIAEQYFVGGLMVFPEAGCYQVFVELEGDAYGPFGFVVA